MAVKHTVKPITKSRKPLVKVPKRKDCLGDHILSYNDLMAWASQFDISIQRFTEATTNLTVELARHAERLDAMETTNDQLRRDTDAKNIDLREKILDSLRRVETRIDTMEKNDAALSNRMVKIEQWKWTIAGGSIVVSAIVAILVSYILHDSLAKMFAAIF